MNQRLLTAFGAPADEAAWAAVALAAFFVLAGEPLMGLLLRAPRKWALGVLATTAIALSLGYVQFYLRGGPRIIDATSYWLEARALSHGQVTWPVAEPTAAERGRFLLMHAVDGEPRLGVIFPPGYPAILALGFLFGAPLWVGPIVAGLLVGATYWLARMIVSGDETTARVAACLSVICATLRYHTADTMSHGWAAVLLTTSLAAALGAAQRRQPGRGQPICASIAGIAFGWLAATRPITAMAAAPVLLVAIWRMRPMARLWLGLCAAGPITCFVLQQHLVTGHLFLPSQSAYYATSDGPPGCFRLGLGKGIGCLHEHGDYVQAVFPHGFGVRAACINLFRRLWIHLSDFANLEPLALLVPVGVWWARRERKVLWVAATLPLVVTAYAFFYFDGSYPGGGARLYADILPIEHVLGALGLSALAARVATLIRATATPLAMATPRATAIVLVLALLGFGFRTSHFHRRFSDREGGRPYFEPSVVAKAKVDHGLLLVNTDSAFNLAYDPTARDPARQIVVARERGDDRDRLVWERLGRPAAYRYRFGGTSDEEPAVFRWTPPPFQAPFRFEAEAEWPPLQQSRGHVEPVYASGTCAWGAQILTARPEPGSSMSARISVPVPYAGHFAVAVQVASKGRVTARLALRRNETEPPLITWGFTANHTGFECDRLSVRETDLSDTAELDFQVQGEEFSVDAVALEPIVGRGFAH